MRTSRGTAHRHARRNGFTLVELVFVMVIMTVAMAMFARTIASSAQLDPVARDTAIAAEAARGMLERMRNSPFAEIYAEFNADPLDDPAGAGTAAGDRFNVPGLDPATPGETVGTIIMPSVDGELRENVENDVLGLPRDLNGDNAVDDLDHKGDAIILPVAVRIEWASKSGREGKRSFLMYTMFADL